MRCWPSPTGCSTATTRSGARSSSRWTTWSAAPARGRSAPRLLLRVLGATGGRISEVLAPRATDVRRDALVLPNVKPPARPVKAVFLSAGDQDLPGELLLFQKAAGLADDEPLFASRKRGAAGRRRAIGRVQAWRIVKDASERAQVRVLALRESKAGAPGAPAPVHPQLFRHALYGSPTSSPPSAEPGRAHP